MPVAVKPDVHFDGGLDIATVRTRLADLRARLIRTGLMVLLASVGVYVAAPLLLNDMMTRFGVLGELVFLAPSEAFVTRIKLAVAGGFALSVPVLLFQTARFLSPLLSPRMRRTAYALIPVAVLLFAAGASFAYAVLLPFALRFLLSFAGPDMVPMLSVAAYIRFVLWLVLPLGLIFQLPIVITFLARLGVLDARSMSRRRKYAVLGIFVVSALLTPADVFSQFLMAVPLLVLYEASILIARFAGRSRATDGGLEKV